ncbi:MAG: tryptophan synthase subunit alpha [Schwartzia sp.]|nr:tryptophan synthase subunit alpha [Schwartzia sp. (in: firmicutes)]
MNRIDSKFQELKAAKKKGLVIFITAGAPDIESTIAAVKMAEANGADAIELGIPFSDPMADGPIIQRSSFEAIKKGMTVKKLIALVKEIRTFTNIPILAMGYLNNLLNYGLNDFFADAKAAGLDGLILPDVPHEESAELRELGDKLDMPIVEFVTPGTVPRRITETCVNAKGFIYCVSVNGVTGVRKIDYGPIGKVAQSVREQSSVPVAVGFGIGSGEAAVEAAAHADAVIVGSAVLKKLLENDMDAAAGIVSEIRTALDKAYN